MNENGSSNTYVGWNWKAGGAAVLNEAGSIDSQVSANTDAGFSILSYTGTGSDLTVGHGLSSAPEMFICKNRAASHNWYVYHKEIGYTGDIFLDLTNAGRTLDIYQSQAPSDSLIYLHGQARVNQSSGNHIMYCFHSVEAYSKVGVYVGNGNANGVFVWTGFRPAWIMQKKSSGTGHWHIWDNTRNPSNEVTRYLSADETANEYTDGGIDILSNGFKARKSGTGLNANAATYIYLAFAEQPFKFANAR